SDLVNSSKRTLDSLVELEEALLEKNPSIVRATDNMHKLHSSYFCIYFVMQIGPLHQCG
ncbi:unnamed protein product, partial [Prunus brigantina]